MKHNPVVTHPKCSMFQRGAELVWNIVFRRRSLLLALMLISGTSAEAATISVTNTNDSGADSLRQAIIGAAPGDTITFSLPPNSKITLTSGELLINKNLTIDGPGRSELTVERPYVSGIPEFRIFHITGNIDVTIKDLAISGGRLISSNHPSNTGGGIRNVNGRLTITNVDIGGNIALSGGGIDNTGVLTMANSAISGNAVYLNGGGGIHNGGTATITKSAIYVNIRHTSAAAAALTNAGTLTITDSTISTNNTANAGVDNGGGLGNIGTATIINSTISGNFVGEDDTGGGIVNGGGGAAIDLTNSTICNNSAAIGGGVAMSGGHDHGEEHDYCQEQCPDWS